MNGVKVGEYGFSPWMIVGTVFALSALPLILVKLFPTQLQYVMAPAAYVAFHNIVEFFSIMVSLSIFGVGWFTYDQTKDRHALFLSASFLAIGLIDFLHTLSNAAMPPFITPNSSNKSIQFWIAVRFLAACAFLGSAHIFPQSRGRWLSRTNLMAASLGITGIVFAGIVFFPSFVPVMFMPGVGLTPFKMVSEYVIIFLLALASLAYWRRMTRTQDRLLLYYIASFIISVFSELTFSTYISVFDTYNVLGHVYKVAAFSLIYWGVFIVAVKAPHKRLLEARGKLREEIVERERVEEQIRVHRDHLEDLVKQRTAELESRNEQLGRENAERRQVEAVLSERTAQLENTNRELESFSYSVSHDLRSPLRAIDGYARMILRRQGEKFDEETVRQFNLVRENARAMGQLIDDLLAFSHLGRQDVTLCRLDMDGLVNEAWEELLTINPGRCMALKVDRLPPAAGDSALMKQVLGNLLSNAIKFTRGREMTLIEVGGYGEETENVYFVRDNGVGFDMRYHDKIFGVFQRLHCAADYEGTGVGLAIVQRVIQRHGGRIWAEGKVDEGACFYFTLQKG